MNVLHMRYAVEVARLGSINKAADELFIAQPNLSRTIKKLEDDLGITIFDRSSKGMNLTPDGDRFIRYAEKILGELDDIERMYKDGSAKKQRFSISVPRASYIADAFVNFSKQIGGDPAEIFYMETNSNTAINNIVTSGYRLGIIRYAANYDKYFKDMLDEKGLSYELVAEFKYVLIMSRSCPLAEKEDISFEDLYPLIEIAHGDPYVPSLPASTVRKTELPDEVERRIFLFERGGQFDLLSDNPETFMWVSPIPKKLLDRYGLVQRSCVEARIMYKDMLVKRSEYSLSELDKRFLTELTNSKRACLV